MDYFWSLSAEYLRRRCPRAWYCAYVLAPAGLADDASELCRAAAARRRLWSKEKFLRLLTSKVVRQLFYRGDSDCALLTATLHRELEFQLRQLLNGTHPHPLRESVTGGRTLTALIAEMRRETGELAVRLVEGALPELFIVPTEERRQLPQPLAVQLNELKLYASPLLAANRGGELWYVEWRRGDFAADAEVTALAHRFHAWNNWRRPPERVKSFLLDAADGGFRYCDPGDISTALRRINAEAAAAGEWRQLSPEAVPCGPEEHCAGCLYAGICGREKTGKE